MDFKLMQVYSADVYEGEVNTLPSCVEPCHNPTISEMLLHPELMIQKRGMYDEGTGIDYVSSDWDDDLQENMNFFESQSSQERPEANEPIKSAHTDKAEDMPNDDEDKGVEPADEEE